MRTIPRFWPSLERLIGCATVAELWRRMLGNDFDAARPLLRATGQLATFYPHRDPGETAYYRVVTHGPDDHVGVCDDTGARWPLSTEELAILELDRPNLAAALIEQLGLTAEAPQHDTVRLGWDNPLAGYRFPVFLLVGPEERDKTHRLLTMQETPLLLITPTRRFVDAEMDELMRRRRAWQLTLDEALAIDEGGLVLTDGGRRALQRFHAAVLPARDGAQEPLFPTPPGARWSQVSIRKVDGHTVSVAVGAVRGVFNYTQLGLADRRNGRPSKQWALLEALLDRHGLLTWDSPAADRRNKKRRELLARQLRRFFRIEGDPIEPCGNGWRTRFSVGEEG